MEDPTTIAMNLTFFGTLGVGLVMFLGVFLAFVVTLLLAGLGRLLATGIAALLRARRATPQPASPKPARTPTPARKEPQLSPEWAAAVARADARASARARAEAAPEVKVSVRELPSPQAPVREIKEVGPLIESATDLNGVLTATPRAFTKPPLPAASPVLDTGSLTALKHQRPQPAQRQDQQRKAS
ncbi:hypothetical protein E7Y32_06205 [Arthrobacter sp. UKPF54-2]|uniref:hypothetical protein n=1 Tax=Arthrobacter sp. UKPF54-2 TaxID=2600159 RepID=UPI0011B18DC4|nr:hypothetical protein [Arthrobacter sp. UKPF54-2]QDY89857.1 hypothetical protein E7Y32_06205 [Arthrobacter sp. UKPF54-2]